MCRQLRTLRSASDSVKFTSAVRDPPLAAKLATRHICRAAVGMKCAARAHFAPYVVAVRQFVDYHVAVISWIVCSDQCECVTEKARPLARRSARKRGASKKLPLTVMKATVS